MQPRRSEYYFLLIWTMVASASQVFMLAALASTLIDEFEISRLQIGLIGAANTLSGALTAPLSGSTVDRIGPRRSMFVVLILSAIGFLFTAAAPTYPLLIAASMFGGIPQGAGNSATNKLIGAEFAEGKRGVVTGIKQSGVQLGVVISGGLIPSAAMIAGWRWAVAALGVLTLGVALYTKVRFPAAQIDEQEIVSAALPASAQSSGRGESEGPQKQPQRQSLPKHTKIIAIYAALGGFTAGGVTRFLPLFAEEELGFSESTAGLVLALSGFLAIFARLSWGRLAEHSIATAPALAILGLGSSLTCWLLLANNSVGTWLIWVVAVASAFSISAWNVVAMLAVIKDVPLEQSGRASGLVLFGFFGGLSLGSPVVGALVDTTGSYQSSWILLGMVALASTAVMVPEVRRSR